MAVGAGKPDIHQGSAVAVRELDGRAFGVREVAVPPLRDRHQDRVEVEALGGQAVLVAGSLPGQLVGLLAQDALVEEEGEPSKRLIPLKTSRITRKVQRSPRTAMARPTVQFSAEMERAGGAVVVMVTL